VLPLFRSLALFDGTLSRKIKQWRKSSIGIAECTTLHTRPRIRQCYRFTCTYLCLANVRSWSHCPLLHWPMISANRERFLRYRYSHLSSVCIKRKQRRRNRIIPGDVRDYGFVHEQLMNNKERKLHFLFPDRSIAAMHESIMVNLIQPVIIERLQSRLLCPTREYFFIFGRQLAEETRCSASESHFIYMFIAAGNFTYF